MHDAALYIVGVFVVPNEPIEDKPLSQFSVQLEDIEKWTGTKFLQFLQRHEVSVVTSDHSWTVSPVIVPSLLVYVLHMLIILVP